MKLLVVSYKVCWRDPSSPSGYVSYGGFPFQMQALSELFSETRLLLLERAGPPPPGAMALEGQNLSVHSLPEPTDTDLRRKLALLAWLPRHLPRIWRELSRADAVHALVPGDLGTLGLWLARLRGKPVSVRHCGTWGDRGTAANRLLAWWLPRLAGPRSPVFATGGGEAPPCPGNPAVHWIFSTTLRGQELARLPAATPWDGSEPLRLITVGRLAAAKNQAAIVRALPEIRRRRPGAHLDVLGEGPELPRLQALAEELGVADAVTLHGNVAHRQVLERLGETHLFVFPTRLAEGFPKACIEALACGLPVLAPPVSVLAHLIDDGNGRLLPGTDAESVAAAVLAITEDPSSLAARGAAARRTAERFTLEGWRDELARHLTAAWGPLTPPATPSEATPSEAATGSAAP